jgi:teichuronic acid biosynthesis glycosyltransferase TuaG
MKELVSIITPTFNSANFIEETIKSVQSQTYTDWEMIIVDDGSTDTTARIIELLSKTDNRIHFYKLEKNSGPAVARNMGIEKAKGKFMTFIDADDIWFPDFIKKSIDVIKQTNIPFVFSSYKRANEKLEFVYSDFIVPNKVTYTYILNSN